MGADQSTSMVYTGMVPGVDDIDLPESLRDAYGGENNENAGSSKQERREKKYLPPTDVYNACLAAYSSDSPRTQRRKGLAERKGVNGVKNSGVGGGNVSSDAGPRAGSPRTRARTRGSAGNGGRSGSSSSSSGLKPRERGRERSPIVPESWGKVPNDDDDDLGNAAITSITQQHPGCLEVAAAMHVLDDTDTDSEESTQSQSETSSLDENGIPVIQPPRKAKSKSSLFKMATVGSSVRSVKHFEEWVHEPEKENPNKYRTAHYTSYARVKSPKMQRKGRSSRFMSEGNRFITNNEL